MKCGFVSIIGRPNVGKSTLLNNILERKLAITSNKPQTTRNTIQGIYNDDESQIIFIDTPGIHKPKHKLGNVLNKQAFIMMEDVDLILFLVDASETLGPGDKFILEKLKDHKNVILLLTKIDKIKNDQILLKIDEYKDLHDFKEIIPISSVKNRNVNELIQTIKKYLNENPKYYDDELVTTLKEEFLISEYIRENVLALTSEEVPHAVTVMIEKIKNEANMVSVYAAVVVDRDSLKKIIIGKQGSMLKNIGSNSRKVIEEYYGKKVYLELFVKTIKNWRDKEHHLNDMGFKL